MSNSFVFKPVRRLGLALHAGGLLLLAGAGVFGLLQASRASLGTPFWVFLLPSLLALGLIPSLTYHGYALYKASYILERGGMRLNWGLRVEEIPMDEIQWVRLADAEPEGTPLPPLRWPGAVLGTVRSPQGGEVEYLASAAKGLVLVSAHGRTFALTPANPEEFVRVYNRFTELGAITPLPARSVYPTLLAGRVWAQPVARALLLAGLALSLLLFIWVSLAITGRSQISLGFLPDGQPQEPVPAVQLLLLPVINGLLFAVDLILGLFFFRLDASQPLAFLLWAGGVITPLLFLIGVFFILRGG